jgi:hypothetical protein
METASQLVAINSTELFLCCKKIPLSLEEISLSLGVGKNYIYHCIRRGAIAKYVLRRLSDTYKIDANLLILKEEKSTEKKFISSLSEKCERIDVNYLKNYFLRKGLSHQFVSRTLGHADSYIYNCLQTGVMSKKSIDTLVKIYKINIIKLVLPQPQILEEDEDQISIEDINLEDIKIVSDFLTFPEDLVKKLYNIMHNDTKSRQLIINLINTLVVTTDIE